MTTVNAMPGRAAVRSVTPKTTRPTVSRTVTTASDIATAVSVRPAMSTQAGTGDARRRLRIPSSRSTVIEMTRLMNDDEMTPSAERPGTYVVDSFTPSTTWLP